MAYAGLPEGATVIGSPKRFAGLPPGAEIIEQPDPYADVPIVPEGPVPELSSAPPQWKIDAHNAAWEVLPPLGAAAGVSAAGLASVPTSGAALAGVGIAGATGGLAGRQAAKGVDAAVGFRPLREPKDAGEAFRQELGAARDIGLAEVAGAVAGAGAVGVAANLGEAGIRYLGRSQLAKRGVRVGKVSEAIRDGLRAVRRTVKGNKTFTQRVGKFNKATDGVLTIAENAEALRYVDDAGEVYASGRAPESLEELSQAIHQIKKQVYAQYDTMAKEAGGTGITIDLKPVVSDLASLLNEEGFAENAPAAVKEAMRMIGEYGERGQYSISGAQKALETLNGQLGGFYASPTVSEAQAAYVKERVAGHLRTILDDAITSAKGPSYKQLRHQYGAIRSIEDEVGHRLVVYDRKSPMGISDYIFNATALHGAVTMSPEGMLLASGAQGLKKFANMRNDPNRRIAKMFKTVGGELARSEKPTALRRVAGRIAGNKGPADDELTRGFEKYAGKYRKTQGLESPIDVPTFQRQGRTLSEYEDIVARGHQGYLDQSSGQLALPGGAGFQAKGITQEMVPGDQLARGHVPYLGASSPAQQSAEVFRANLPQSPAAERAAVFEQTAVGHRPIEIPEPPLPIPKSAAESAEVFSTMPSQTPAADIADTFTGPSELIRRSPAGRSAAVFEKAIMRNKTPQAMEAIQSRLAAAADAPTSGHGLPKTPTVRVGGKTSPKWVKKEVKSMLPPDTPQWMVNEYVDIALGKTPAVSVGRRAAIRTRGENEITAEFQSKLKQLLQGIAEQRASIEETKRILRSTEFRPKGR